MRLGSGGPARPQRIQEESKADIRFEKVSRFADIEVEAPIRKTERSAGYDMVAAESIIVPSFFNKTNDLNDFILEGYDELPPYFTLSEMAVLTKQSGCKPTLVSTGHKVYLPADHSLNLHIRSSSPLKYWLVLANGVGVIDADYVDNPDNEGEIFFQIINFNPYDLIIQKGEIIGQGLITPFVITDNDAEQQKQIRISGLGSTTQNG